MKLKIENFQSLVGPYELDFKPGITMIVGASNSGKTAIQRALRGLILNYIPTSKASRYITHFQDHLQIDLQLEEDSPIYTLYKDHKNTSYSVDDQGEVQDFEKAGNDDLESICNKADLDFPFVIRDKQLLNTYTEKEGLPFPFNLNDVEMFKMFEELYNVSSSSIIFKFMKKLEMQTNSSISKHKEEITYNKTRIDKIIEVEDRYDLDKLEILKARADKVQAGMIGLDEDIDVARKNNRTSKAIKQVLDNKRDVEDIDSLLNKTNSLLKDSNSLQKDIRIVNSNNKIDNINVYKKEFDTTVIEPFKALSSDFNIASKLEKELKWNDEEVTNLQDEYRTLKEELDRIEVCPLCGQTLKGEHRV